MLKSTLEKKIDVLVVDHLRNIPARCDCEDQSVGEE